VVAHVFDLPDTTPRKPRGVLSLDFPLVEPRAFVKGLVSVWHPSRDVALLRLTADPPERSRRCPVWAPRRGGRKINTVWSSGCGHRRALGARGVDIRSPQQVVAGPKPRPCLSSVFDLELQPKPRGRPSGKDRVDRVE